MCRVMNADERDNVVRKRDLAVSSDHRRKPVVLVLTDEPHDCAGRNDDVAARAPGDALKAVLLGVPRMVKVLEERVFLALALFSPKPSLALVDALRTGF